MNWIFKCPMYLLLSIYFLGFLINNDLLHKLQTFAPNAAGYLVRIYYLIWSYVIIQCWFYVLTYYIGLHWVYVFVASYIFLTISIRRIKGLKTFFTPLQIRIGSKCSTYNKKHKKKKQKKNKVYDYHWPKVYDCNKSNMVH